MLHNLFLVVPFLLLVHVTTAVALPECDENYSGHCYGSYTFTSGLHSGDKYVGEMKDGAWQGHGTYTWLNGDKYVGEYWDGKRHGQGTHTFPNGEKYVGEWRNDQKHGYGSLLLSNNDPTIFSGRGIKGLEILGNFVEGFPEGNVTLYWLNGDVWVGRVRGLDWLGGIKYTAGNVPPEVYASRGGDAPPQQAQRPDTGEIIPAALPPCPTDPTSYFDNCEGTYTWTSGPNSGDKYVGEWRDDNMHGQGTYTWTAGERHVGEFRNGQANGQGTHTWADGDKAVGEFRDGQSHGHAIYTFSPSSSDNYIAGRNLSGSVCDCNWQNGEANGNGTIYWSNGDVWVGRLSNNDWLNGNKYTAGNVPPEVYASRGGDAPPQQAQRPDSDEIIPAASGSGFVISKAGHIVTNHHVIDGCNQVEVHQKGNSYRATVVETDIVNDLAILKADFTPTTVFSINNSNAELLQDVYVAGYPFGDAISTSVKVTKGIVSSLSGIGNNYSNMQIDAALQPGNSGGPILDDAGNVVGVAVAKLDLALALEVFDVVPEDTNFGIKSSVLKNFLEANGIETIKPSTHTISRTELGKKITDGTLFLSCLMTYAQIEKLRAEKVMFTDLE